jgi:NDP-sugar pyrophosphorylase family protein
MPPLVVLAGGLGTRLRPVTRDGPKALADVAGEPMLLRALTHWRASGARRAVVCLGHHADNVELALRNWGLDLQISVSKEPSPLGTGGAVRYALGQLPEEFFVVNGDTLIDVSLEAVWRWHRRGAWRGTLLVHHGPDVEGDRLETATDGAVVALAGRGPALGPYSVFAGVALLNRSLFKSMRSGTVANLETDVLAPAVASGVRLGALCTRRRFFDLGTPERLLQYVRRPAHD